MPRDMKFEMLSRLYSESKDSLSATQLSHLFLMPGTIAITSFLCNLLNSPCLYEQTEKSVWGVCSLWKVLSKRIILYELLIKSFLIVG